MGDERGVINMNKKRKLLIYSSMYISVLLFGLFGAYTMLIAALFAGQPYNPVLIKLAVIFIKPYCFSIMSNVIIFFLDKKNTSLKIIMVELAFGYIASACILSLIFNFRISSDYFAGFLTYIVCNVLALFTLSAKENKE